MKTEVESAPLRFCVEDDIHARLRALHAQIRAEVDAALPRADEDKFTNSAYHGPREFRRATCRPRSCLMAESEKSPRPGELRLKDWIEREVKRTGISKFTLYSRVKNHSVPGLAIREVAPRIVFVRPLLKAGATKPVSHQPLPGEVRLRDWVRMHCERAGCKPNVIWRKWLRGELNPKSVRYVTRRTVFVVP